MSTSWSICLSTSSAQYTCTPAQVPVSLSTLKFLLRRIPVDHHLRTLHTIRTLAGLSLRQRLIFDRRALYWYMCFLGSAINSIGGCRGTVTSVIQAVHLNLGPVSAAWYRSVPWPRPGLVIAVVLWPLIGGALAAVAASTAVPRRSITRGRLAWVDMVSVLRGTVRLGSWSVAVIAIVGAWAAGRAAIVYVWSCRGVSGSSSALSSCGHILGGRWRHWGARGSAGSGLV